MTALLEKKLQYQQSQTGMQATVKQLPKKLLPNMKKKIIHSSSQYLQLIQIKAEMSVRFPQHQNTVLVELHVILVLIEEP